MTTLAEALRNAKPVSDGQLYSILRLPAGAITAGAGVLAEIGEPFLALVADDDEVTLVVHADAAEAISRRLPDAQISPGWRLVTFDAVLDHDLVGFMAAVAKALAEANVSLFALSAYERDHLLVKAGQFEVALAALTALQAGP